MFDCKARPRRSFLFEMCLNKLDNVREPNFRATYTETVTLAGPEPQAG